MVAYKFTKYIGYIFVVIVVSLIVSLGASGFLIAIPAVTPPGTVGYTLQTAAG